MSKSKTILWNGLFVSMKKYLLVILPVTFLIIAILIHYSNGEFYLLSTDPEYFHLFNGLNLSNFNLAVDYIDHPGTTVQILFAVSAHIVNLVLPGSDIITNALNNPEQFIHGANILMNVIISITLFLLGYYTFKSTGNIYLSVLLQLTPFCSIKLLTISGRLLPESVMIIPLLLFTTLIIKYIYDNNYEAKTSLYLIGFAIIGGLGAATKFLYLPFLIIPLFLLPSKRSKWQYILFTAIAIIIFAFPVFVHLGKTWSWLTNMFMHSGQWGSGESNIIDVHKIPGRLRQIYNIDPGLFIIIGAAIFQLILFSSISFLKRSGISKILRRTLLGVLTSILLSVILVTKHFAYHYFLPNLVFKVFIIFLMTSLVLELIYSKRIKAYLSMAVMLITILFIAVPQVNELGSVIHHKHIVVEKFEKRAQILKKYNDRDKTLIISSHYRGSPFIQSALAGGFMLSGQLRSTFREQLTNSYPNTYLFVAWSDQFYSWDEFVDADEFIDTNKTIYMFIGEEKESNIEIILQRIENQFPLFEINMELLYHFNDPEEYFYEISLSEKDNQ